MKYITTIGDAKFIIDVNHDGQVTIDGAEINVDMQQMFDSTMYSVLIDGKSHDLRMNEGDGVYAVQLSGAIFEVVVEDERTRRLAGLKSGATVTKGEIIIKAPMPGVVVEVTVVPEQEVAAGEVVLILESMKMQNEFKSPRAGKVRAVRVSSGEKINQGAVMVIIA